MEDNGTMPPLSKIVASQLLTFQALFLVQHSLVRYTNADNMTTPTVSNLGTLSKPALPLLLRNTPPSFIPRLVVVDLTRYGLPLPSQPTTCQDKVNDNITGDNESSNTNDDDADQGEAFEDEAGGHGEAGENEAVDSEADEDQGGYEGGDNDGQEPPMKRLCSFKIESDEEYEQAMQIVRHKPTKYTHAMQAPTNVEAQQAWQPERLQVWTRS